MAIILSCIFMQSRRGAIVTPLISLAINQWGSVFVCPPLSPDGLPLWREWMRLEAERRAKVKVWHLVIQGWGTGAPSGCSASQQLGHIVVVAADTSQITAKCKAVQQIFMLLWKKPLYHTGSLCISVIKTAIYGGV